MENLTQQQIDQSISAAFDSVNLINELNLLPALTQEDAATKQRNSEHLQVMMAKEWFSTNLTAEQTDQINSVMH